MGQPDTSPKPRVWFYQSRFSVGGVRCRLVSLWLQYWSWSAAPNTWLPRRVLHALDMDDGLEPLEFRFEELPFEVGWEQKWPELLDVQDGDIVLVQFINLADGAGILQRDIEQGLQDQILTTTRKAAVLLNPPVAAVSVVSAEPPSYEPRVHMLHPKPPQGVGRTKVPFVKFLGLAS